MSHITKKRAAFAAVFLAVLLAHGGCGGDVEPSTGPATNFGIPSPGPVGRPPFVDLRTFGVIAGCTSCAAANTADVKTAITAFASTGAELRFPPGIVYLDEGLSTSAAGFKPSILLDARHDFVLSGGGAFVTTLEAHGTGDGGNWDILEIGNGSVRIEVRDLGFKWDNISVPPDQVHGHDINVAGTIGQSGSTSLVSIHDVFFGATIGDALHVAGGDGSSLVEHVRLERAFATLAGQANFSSGAHSAVTVLGAYNDVAIGNAYLKGSVNGLVVVAGTGTASENGFYLHDAWLDDISNNGFVALQLAGTDATTPATNAVVAGTWVLEGGVLVQDTAHTRLDGLHVIETSAIPNSASALVHAFHANTDLVLQDLDLQRLSGSTAGDLLLADDLSSSAAPKRLAVTGGKYLQQTQATAIEIKNCDECALRGPDIRWEGATPSAARGVTLTADSYDLTSFTADAVKISSTTALADCFYLFGNGHTINDISITSTQAALACTTGVRVDNDNDRAPLIQGNNFFNSTNVWVGVNSASGTTFPMTFGSRGSSSARAFEGTVAPETVVTGRQGDLYTWLAGDSTLRYVKLTGTGPTGWHLTSEFTTGVTISGGHLVLVTPAPTPSSCGSGPTIVGNDVGGTVTEGTGASGCTLTFGSTYTTAPTCNISSEAGLGFTFATTATTLVITNVGALSSTKLDYFCSGH